MKIEPYEIPGLFLVTLMIHRDDRGFFCERYNQRDFDREFARLGATPPRFVQDNHSRSAAHVLRGLHAQRDPGQAKLVGAIRGKIWDVAVDLRKGSPTYGKHASVELDGESGKLLYIPGGFAHGFCVLSAEGADVLYKVDQHYDPLKEMGIAWNDPELNLPWPIQAPLLSGRDQKNLPISKHSNWQGL